MAYFTIHGGIRLLFTVAGRGKRGWMVDAKVLTLLSLLPVVTITMFLIKLE